MPLWTPQDGRSYSFSCWENCPWLKTYLVQGHTALLDSSRPMTGQHLGMKATSQTPCPTSRQLSGPSQLQSVLRCWLRLYCCSVSPPNPRPQSCFPPFPSTGGNSKSNFQYISLCRSSFKMLLHGKHKLAMEDVQLPDLWAVQVVLSFTDMWHIAKGGDLEWMGGKPWV